MDLTIDRVTLRGLYLTYRGMPYQLCLCAAYQAVNAATVLETVGALRRAGMNLPEGEVVRALAAVRFPARFEVLSIAPVIVVDGAHNRPGLEALCASLLPLRSRVTGRLHLMLGMLRDKNPAEVLGALNALFVGENPFALGQIYVLTPDTPRAMPAEELAGLLRTLPVLRDAEILVPTDAEEAARQAVRGADEGDALICFGSLFLAGPMRQLLRDELDQT